MNNLAKPKSLVWSSLISSALLTACVPTPRTSTLSHPNLNIGAMGSRTHFELQQAANASDNSSVVIRPSPTKAVFWSALGLTILGGVSSIALGAAAFHTSNQIKQGFNEGLTNAELNQLGQRGEQLNKATIATISVTAIAATVALVVYGIDYTRCGALAPKRRQCKLAHRSNF